MNVDNNRIIDWIIFCWVDESQNSVLIIVMRLYQKILLTHIVKLLLNDNCRSHFLQHVQMDSSDSSSSISVIVIITIYRNMIFHHRYYNHTVNIVGIDSDFDVFNRSKNHWLKVDWSLLFHIILDCIRFIFIIDGYNIEYCTQSSFIDRST